MPASYPYRNFCSDGTLLLWRDLHNLHCVVDIPVFKKVISVLHKNYPDLLESTFLRRSRLQDE